MILFATALTNCTRLLLCPELRDEQGDGVDSSKQEYEFRKAAYRWYSWDSPVGLALGLVGLSLSLALILSSVGLLLWLLHQATLIG